MANVRDGFMGCIASHPCFTCSIVHNTAVGRFLIAWFNDCVLGKSGQIATPIITKIEPVPYNCSIRKCLCL